MLQRHNRFLPVFLLILLALIWGSSFILMKIGLQVFTPMQVGTLRMLVAFICLLPLTLKHIGKVAPKHWGWITISGITGNGLPALLFATAQTKLSSSVAGVLNSLTPIFTLLIAALFYGQRFGAAKITGILLGFAGAALLTILRSTGAVDTNYLYALLIVGACVCYGISVNVIKVQLAALPALAISSLALVAIGPVFGIYLFGFTDFTTRIASPQAWKALGCIVVLGALGSAAALVLFNQLVKVSTVIVASSVTYLIPIVALGWGFVAGEALGWPQLIGMLTILGGIYLINKK